MSIMISRVVRDECNQRIRTGLLVGLFVVSIVVVINEAPTAAAQLHPYSLDFSTYLGGSLFEQARDVATDKCGNIYVTGGTQSTDFPTTAGAYNRTNSGWMDVFVVKMNRAGQLVWSTYLGGPNYDRAYAIEVDDQGYVYVGGRAGDGFPTTPGVLQTTFAGDTNPGAYGTQDGFVAKLTPDGSQVVWATYFGGPGSDFNRDIDIDDSGNVYLGVAGANQDNPHITPGAFDTVRNGSDAMIAKINANATTVLFASYLGGSTNDGGAPTVRVDADNNVYHLMATDADDAPATPTSYQPARGGGIDVVLTKFDTNGTYLWGTYFGGSGNEGMETHHLAIDPFGNPVIATYTTSNNLPTNASVVQPSYGGNGDFFIARLTANGTSLLGVTYLGGSGNDGVEGVTIDEAGDIYVSGATNSLNFPTTLNAYQGSLAGGSDMIGVKIDITLTELHYSTYFGGSGNDDARSSTIWQNRSFILVGQTNSNDFPRRIPYQGSYGGGTGDNAVVGFLWWDNPPIADAGSDQTVPKNTLVTLDGTGSYDPDGDCLFYSWNQTAGPPVTLVGPTTARPTFTSSIPSVYSFNLTVNDCRTFVTDSVNVTVTGEPPIAMLAVNPTTLLIGQNAEVTANGSSDSDGVIITYNFTFGDGNGTGDISMLYAFYAWSIAGNYTVNVTVTDDDGFTDSASVNVRILSPGSDLPPTAVINVTPSTIGNLSTVFVFNGSGSWDAEGPIASYLWDFGDGSNATTAIASHTYLTRGSHTVTLTVWDTYGWDDTDTVTVGVLNRAPSADAGQAQSHPKRTTITLDGSLSFDPDGDMLSYFWRQSSGPQAYLSNYDTAMPAFIPSQVGLYTFVLTVSDSWLNSTDSVNVDVFNRLPMANAGQDSSTSKNSMIILDGSASADPDGDDLTVLWSQTSGPPITLVGADTVKASASVHYSGVYTFELVLTDEDGAQSTDTVVFTVVNRPPVIIESSPSDVTVSLKTGENLTLVVVATDADKDILSYSWKLNGVPIGGNMPFFVFQPSQQDSFVINVTVSDSEDETWMEWTVNVQAPETQPDDVGTEFPWWIIVLILAIVAFILLLLYVRERRRKGKGATSGDQQNQLDDPLGSQENSPDSRG